MPESRANALRRARRLGTPISQVTKGESGYFIAPRGERTRAAKKAYAALRSRGISKRSAARQSWAVEKRARRA